MGFYEFYFSMITPEIYQQFPLSRFVFGAIALIFAVVILALFVTVAVLSKKQRVIGVVAGVANFVLALLIPTFVKTWHNIFTPLRMLESSATEAQAMQVLFESFKNLAVVLVVTAIMTVSLVLTIVFIVKSFKNKPVICSIGALVLVILRQLWIAPFPMTIPMIAKAFLQVEATSPFFLYDQIFQLCAYFGVLVLALVLVLVPVVIIKIKESKAPVAVAEETPKVDEAAE